MILTMLSFLGRHAPAIMAASIFAGLVLPEAAAWCRPAVVPSVYALLFLSLLQLDWPAVARYARRPGPALLALVWMLIAAPLAAAALLPLLGAPPALANAVVLNAAAPPMISSVAFALLFGLDAPFAALTLGATLVLTPFTLPLMALGLLGLEIQIGLGDFILRLAILVGSTLLAAGIVRRVLGGERIQRHAAAIDGAAVLVLILFAFGIMAGVAARMLANPGQVALWAAVAFLANLGMQALAGLGFAWLGRERALTLAMMSGNRNLALLIAVLAATADVDTMLYLVLGQLPIFILPAALTPLYRRLLNARRR